MTNLKVSIITVCLNSIKTIEQTICSVINQTYKNIEYIIIDGQSTDGTIDIIKKYEKHITRWISEPDKGIYDAMNKGISMATGEIIGIINSDDWYEQQAVEKVMEVFANEQTDVVYGKLKIVHANGYMSEAKNGSLEQMVYRMVIPHPTSFVKREVYEKFGTFDIQYKIVADYELYLRWYLKNVLMKQTDDVLAYFREGGFTTDRAVECAEEVRQVSGFYAEKCGKEELLPAIEAYYEARVGRAKVKKIQSDLLNKGPELANRIFFDFFNGEKEIYIFGAGSVGIDCLEFLQKCNIKVSAFIDNDKKKEGTSFMGVPVVTPTNYKSEMGYILITSMNYGNEIKKQLEELGYVQNLNFCLYSDLFYELEKRMRI